MSLDQFRPKDTDPATELEVLRTQDLEKVRLVCALARVLGFVCVLHACVFLRTPAM
jgi:hypothetical protein